MNDHHHHHGDDKHHHYHHDHDDSGSGSGQGEMPMSEKLKKMVEHWLKHNADHAATYRQWAERARQAGMPDVAEILEGVAKDSQAINGDLERAGEVLAEKN
ncbi:MAG: hypothetical protein KGY38_05095 [Desulfobacterales bacterium]|nr:hypothetical protein [Desulfobacterales bacterium]